MKNLLDIRYVIILILILICTLEFINPKGFMPNRVKIKVDSIQYIVHDTISVDSIVEVEVLVPYEVEKIIEVQVLQKVDTNEIMKIHFTKVPYSETLILPNNQGSINITDTISKNSIVNRKFIADVKNMIIKDTIYSKEPKKTQMFFGLKSGFSSLDVISHIGAGFMFKTKEDKLYHVGVGVANRTYDGINGNFTPYVDGGVYWKINIKK